MHSRFISKLSVKIIAIFHSVERSFSGSRSTATGSFIAVGCAAVSGSSVNFFGLLL